MPTPLLSIGMIFKNEIRCLERCLKSLQPLRDAIPCELVMADTGSDDGSHEIAEKYADILIDSPWINDFSAARNATMERSTGKWYMFIDCDEWLAEDISSLVNFLTTNETHFYGAVTIRNYHTEDLEKGGEYADFTACRLLRMSTGLRFVGTIHEHWPEYHGEQHILLLQSMIFHHDGYLFLDPEVTKAKHERNMVLLRERLKQDPDDLVTIMQCIESTSDDPDDSSDYIAMGIQGVEEHKSKWRIVGPPILRYAVVTAFKTRNYATIEEDVARAEKMFPDSMYTRLDVEFVAFGYSWSKNDYSDCIRRGERYLKAHKDFESGNYNPIDILASTLSTSASSFKMQLMIFLSAAYLYEKQPEKCLEIISELDGGKMSLKHVGDIVRTCAHLHARSELDTAPVILNLWEQINRPTPTEERALQRRNEFIRLASQLFQPAYREDENRREDFHRYSYTLFLPLRGMCVLGNAAAILETADPGQMEMLMTETDNLNLIPVSALIHALQKGTSFPPSSKPMKMEELDILAGRFAQDRVYLKPLIKQISTKFSQMSLQNLDWARALTLAAIRSTSDWRAEGQSGWAQLVSQTFVLVERAFLPRCYAAETLTEENINILPPMHRFGWYCTQAFDALENGNPVGYVRFLRAGLKSCGDMKPMVEFLLEHTPELQAQPAPSAELLTLAEQIRGVLANFAPDDPAVAALKQSEAYQSVAHLIEGAPAVGWGGLAQ